MKNNLWNKEISLKLAIKEKIKLNNDHWKIIIFIRNFYLNYGISPNIDTLIIFYNKKYNNTLNINSLNSLFKKNPKILIYKISCIPKPIKCIL